MDEYDKAIIASKEAEKMKIQPMGVYLYDTGKKVFIVALRSGIMVDGEESPLVWEVVRRKA